jgi:hypothetical protein
VRIQKKWRSIVAPVTLTGVVAFLGALAAPAAQAEGVTPPHLAAQGWTCFPAPPFVVPPRLSCANPGLGRPFPGPPGQPTYMFLAFDLDGNFIGTVHLIRVDLYRGQPCGPAGEPYVFRGLIGYYECVTF